MTCTQPGLGTADTGAGVGSTSCASLTWSCSSCSSEKAPKKFLTVSLRCCCTISCPIRRQIKAMRLIVLTHRTMRAWAPLGKLKRTSILPACPTHIPFPLLCFPPPILSRFQELSGLQQHKLYARTADQHKDVHTWLGTAPQSPKIIGPSQYHFHTPDFTLCKLWLKTLLTAALTRRPGK